MSDWWEIALLVVLAVIGSALLINGMTGLVEDAIRTWRRR